MTSSPPPSVTEPTPTLSECIQAQERFLLYLDDNGVPRESLTYAINAAILAHLRSPAPAARPADAELDARRAVALGENPPSPSNNYIQSCPDHVDRVIWRGNYYTLDEDRLRAAVALTEEDQAAVRWALLKLSPNWPREGEKHLATLRRLAERGKGR